MKWRLCDLTAVFRYYRSLWLSDTQQNDAHATDQRNIRIADKVSMSIYDRQNINLNAIKHWDRRKINIY